MTKEVCLLFKQTHKLYEIAKETKNTVDIELYRASRRLAKKTWRRARYIYHQRIFMENIQNPGGKSAALWKIIKSNSGKGTMPTISPLKVDQTFIIDEEKRAVILNEYFVGQSTLDLSLHPCYLPP